MGKIDELRKIVEARKKQKAPKFERIDDEKVEKIVERMKKKYSEEGIEFQEVGGKLKELRGIIAEQQQAKIEVQTVEELKEAKNSFVRALGNFYLKLRFLTQPISNLFKRFPQMRQLSYYLYSANMKYSAKQYLAMVTALGLIVFVLMLVISSLILSLMKVELVSRILLIVLISLIVSFFMVVIGFLGPRRKAQARGDAVSRELPFALRHMATELRAGIGLYRTIQTIAVADYGALSEEFARTITEIEEGTDTKLALRHFALRTQSKALRNALIHIIRALKTGGNLSNIMNDIAEDVSFQLRLKIRDFSEKMNFFATIYIYIGIVIPVFIGILGGVKATPLQVAGQETIFHAIPLDPPMLILFYAIFMPIVLIYLIVFLSILQPKV